MKIGEKCLMIGPPVLVLARTVVRLLAPTCYEKLFPMRYLETAFSATKEFGI